MNTLPYRISAVTDGAGGWLTIELDKSKLGFSPADTFSSVQVSLTGLDSGTFSVSFKPRGAKNFVSFIQDAIEDDAVLLDRSFVFEAIRVAISGAGGAAAPVAQITFISRSF